MTYDIQIDDGRNPSMLVAAADLQKGQFVGLDLQPAAAQADILGVCLKDSAQNNPISLGAIGTFYVDVEVGASAVLNVGDELEVKDASTLQAKNTGVTVAKAYEKVDNSAGGSAVVKKIPVKIIK
ncbi:hypothetical protein DRJ17_00760 [Candidatus Woesearchaeota archaeon]|nr:MAG: hypothetical protein DRJ17_00760 [Candidatus Woesearchaeota archaeon]